MKVIFTLLKFIIIIIIVYVISGFMARSSYKIEQETEINAPQKLVYNQLGILRNWENWKTFSLNNQVKIQFAGEDAKPGSSLHWKDVSNNGHSTELKLTDVNPPFDLQYQCYSPGLRKMTSDGLFKLSEIDNHKTRVHWIEVCKLPFLVRPIMMFSDLENEKGSLYKQSLQKLDSLCEQQYLEVMKIMKSDSVAGVDH